MAPTLVRGSVSLLSLWNGLRGLSQKPFKPIHGLKEAVTCWFVHAVSLASCRTLPVQPASLSQACSLMALVTAVLTYLDVATSFSLFRFQLPSPLQRIISDISCSNHLSPEHLQNMTFEVLGHHCGQK